MPDLNGGSHFVIVVRDARRSADWYCRVFGFVVLREGVKAVVPDGSKRMTAFTFTSLMDPDSKAFLGLAQVEDGCSDAFDWRRIGLQHFGFHVPERSDLDDWARHLDQLGIAHLPVMEEGTGYVVRFRDPDDLPIELFWADIEHFREQLDRVAGKVRDEDAG